MSEATFRRELRYIVRALWESAITKSQFQSQMSKILETEFTNAWAEGAEECGIKPDEYNDEEIKALNFFISNQIDFIPGFADAIVEKNRKNDGNILSLFERAKLWLNRYLDAKNQAKSLACKDAKLEWQVGMRGCKEHCFPANTLISCKDENKVIQSVDVGDYVLTTLGYRQVSRKFISHYKGNLIKVSSGDKKVICTPNHPFLTNRGWIEAESIRLSDKIVLQQNIVNKFFSQIMFPYSFNKVATSCKIFILCLVSFLLSFLSICQRLKSRMTMPVISICLDNEVSDFDVYNKIGLYKELRLKINFKFYQVLNHLSLQFCWFIFSYFLMTNSQSFKGFIFPLLIFPTFFNFVFGNIILHWIMVSHIFFGFIVNNSMGSFFAELKMNVIRFTDNLVGRQPKYFSNLCSSQRTIVLNEKIGFFFVPYFLTIFNKLAFNFLLQWRILMSVLSAKLIFSPTLMTTNGTGFPVVRFMSNWAIVNPSFISASRGTKFKFNLIFRTRIYKTFKLLSTIFAYKTSHFFSLLFSRIGMTRLSNSIIVSTFRTAIWIFLYPRIKDFTTFLASMIEYWHVYPLHQSNVTNIEILYNQVCDVYNLEVDYVHNYVANNFVVHNCSTCLSLNGKVKRASYWQKIGIHPQSTRLACGGFRCCCGFVPTSKPLSKGRLPVL